MQDGPVPTAEVTLPRAVYERFRDGDADAFAEIVRVYMGLVRRVAASFFRDAFLQEEAMQEVWIHVWNKRASLDLERVDAFAGWLSVLARRRCIDVLRQVKPATPIEDVDAVAPPTPARVEGVEETELKNAAAAFRAKLDGDWARFFDLCFVEGLDYAEITEKLGISRLRCKYMKKVLATRARKNRGLLDALGRTFGPTRGGRP